MGEPEAYQLTENLTDLGRRDEIFAKARARRVIAVLTIVQTQIHVSGDGNWATVLDH